jgi:hypothetical protein
MHTFPTEHEIQQTENLLIDRYHVNETIHSIQGYGNRKYMLQNKMLHDLSGREADKC